MGYDTSYHPVDISLIKKRLVPFIMGMGDIDDLIADATRIAANRFLANAWGYGAYTAASALQKGAMFNSDIFIWGRPFFITYNEPERIGAAIDSYKNATLDQVEDIVHSMLNHLDPEIAKATKPDPDSILPPVEVIREATSWKICFLATAFACIQKKETIKAPDGREHDPIELISTSAPHAIIEFASHLTPGWMSRGYTWPTRVLPTLGFKPSDFFTDASDLFSDLLPSVNKLRENINPTITENYTIGGFVAPNKVPALLDTFRVPKKTGFLDKFKRRQESLKDTDLQKLLEALQDTKSRNFAFLEATEIYSGPLGIMN